MQRLNEILAKSREAKQQAQTSEAAQKLAQQTGVGMGRLRQLSSFVKYNKLPRYVLFGVIMLKSMSIYDKMQQLVAINQMSVAMITQQSATLRKHFDSEEELQDLLTKRMLEAQYVNDDEDDLGQDAAPAGQYTATPGMTGMATKAKSERY